MEKKDIIMLAVLAALVIAVAFFLRARNTNMLVEDTKYDDLAKCITAAGVEMGGTDWCGHCKNQKEKFGSSFQYIKFHNCDTDKWCGDMGITGYPTWVDTAHNNTLYVGGQELAGLAGIAGCSIE